MHPLSFVFSLAFLSRFGSESWNLCSVVGVGIKYTLTSNYNSTTSVGMRHVSLSKCISN